MFCHKFFVFGQTGCAEEIPHTADHSGISCTSFGADSVVEVFVIKKIHHDIDETVVKVLIFQHHSEIAQSGGVHPDSVSHALFCAIGIKMELSFFKQIFVDELFSAVP